MYNSKLFRRTQAENYIVTKKNDILPSFAQLNLMELRLLNFCIAHYDSRKPDDRTKTKTVAEFAKTFQLSVQSVYGKLKKTMSAFADKPLKFRTDKEEGFCCMLNMFSFKYYKGRFDFKLSPEIRPYLLDIKVKFTSYRISAVFNFKSARTWRLYEHLKRWQEAGSWKVSLEELKKMHGYPQPHSHLLLEKPGCPFRPPSRWVLCRM